jgi:predicted phage tail component-like protein
MTSFTYNGRSSADFGLHIEKKDVFSAPEYDAEFISIPGRSGDIINPNCRFANIKVTYTVFLARKNIAALAAVLRDIKGWLYSEPDRYHELTDSYDAEYFRYGVISGNLDIEEQLNKIGCFTVTFNCKPFKYSYEGQQTIAADGANLSVTNPYAFVSKPYIKLYGSGAVALSVQPESQGMTAWTISGIDEYIEIDSELMNCYKDTVLKNDTVKGAAFPVLKPGNCTIACTGDVTRIEVVPRWCCL